MRKVILLILSLMLSFNFVLASNYYTWMSNSATDYIVFYDPAVDGIGSGSATKGIIVNNSANVSLDSNLLKSTEPTPDNWYIDFQTNYTSGNISCLIDIHDSTSEYWYHSAMEWTSTGDQCGILIYGRTNPTQVDYFDNSAYQSIDLAPNFDTQNTTSILTYDLTGDAYYVRNYYSQNGTLISNVSVNPWTGDTCDKIGRIGMMNNAVGTQYVWLSKIRCFLGYSIPGFKAFNITSYNCTSCDPPDTTPPYETEDTTPTFRIVTTEAAWCRISDTDSNYTAMGESRDCTSGAGTTEHVCTLTAQDTLVQGTDYVYISCKDSNNNENQNSTSGAMEMSITFVQGGEGYDAIAAGIGASSIWPDATIYESQPVFVRTLNSNQAYGIFDKVAVYGTQRWAFNYVSENETTIEPFYNLSPYFYYLEMDNLTEDVVGLVKDFIDLTKR